MQKLWIGNQWVAGKQGKTRTIENPATLEKIEDVVEGTAEDVAFAVETAKTAQRK